MESPHNYENSRHETAIYACPGATSFEVEFDERCETEKRWPMSNIIYSDVFLREFFEPILNALDIHRYDYLEFTDSRGGKFRYDMKVGTEKWPKVGYGKALSFSMWNAVVS